MKMVYSEQCLQIGILAGPSPNHRCSKMIKISRNAFRKDSLSVTTPKYFNNSTYKTKTDEKICSKRPGDSSESLTICNCCSDFLVHCATQHIKIARRLLNDTKLFEFDSECDSAQKCAKKVPWLSTDLISGEIFLARCKRFANMGSKIKIFKNNIDFKLNDIRCCESTYESFVCSQFIYLPPKNVSRNESDEIQGVVPRGACSEFCYRNKLSCPFLRVEENQVYSKSTI